MLQAIGLLELTHTHTHNTIQLIISVEYTLTDTMHDGRECDMATSTDSEKAPKVQMPRCSNMCASMQLADAYDSTYSCSRAMEAVSWKHQNSIMQVAEL